MATKPPKKETFWLALWPSVPRKQEEAAAAVLRKEDIAAATVPPAVAMPASPTDVSNTRTGAVVVHGC